MKKIISSCIFLVAFQQWLPTCFLSFTTERITKKEDLCVIHTISMEWPPDVQPLRCSASQTNAYKPKSELPYTSLTWLNFHLCIDRLDPAAGTITRNLRVIKSTVILSCPTRVFPKKLQWSLLLHSSCAQGPIHHKDPEEISGPGQKPPTGIHPSNLELPVPNFSVGYRTVCLSKIKGHDL